MAQSLPRRRGATFARVTPHKAKGDPWFTLLSRWQDHIKAQGLSETTASKHAGFLIRFIAKTHLDPAVVTEQDVEHFLREVDARGPTREGYVQALRSYYGWAVPRGLHERNPVELMRQRNPKYPPPVSLTEEEFIRVVYAAANRQPYPKRALAIILTIETGGRIGSVAGLGREDVGIAPGQLLHFRVAKGDRPYSVPLSPLAAWAIRELIPSANGTLLGVKKNSIWRWYHEAAVDAGLPKRKQRAHVLRDSFATNLLMGGTDVRTTQALLNHADLSQMAKYVAVTDKGMRRAMSSSIASRFTE